MVGSVAIFGTVTLNGPLPFGAPSRSLVSHSRAQVSKPTTRLNPDHVFGSFARTAVPRREKRYGPNSRRANRLFDQVALKPLAALFPHAVGYRVPGVRLFQKLQPVGSVLVARFEVFDERLHRLDVDAFVFRAVGEIQRFWCDRRFAILGVDRIDELTHAGAE